MTTNKPTLLAGKVYGGMKVVAMTPGLPLITVKCMRCGYVVKRDRELIRTGQMMSCGGFGCRERSKSFNSNED